MKIGLRTRLISSFLLVGLLPLIGIGYYFYSNTTTVLEKESIERLSAVEKVKSNAIKDYFSVIKSQVKTLAHDVMVVDAMKGFTKSFKDFNSENRISKVDLIFYKNQLKKYYSSQFGAKYREENGESINTDQYLNQLSDTEIALQYYYIANNENPLGSKEQLVRAADRSEYSKLHAKYHPSISEFLSEFGYYDIFLVDNKTGHIVYSVYKELDYATSLKSGPYRNTNFAEVFNRAKNIENREDFAIVDYAQYTPSYEAPASFIATPIWDGDQKIGVLVFQMPIDRLNTVMLDRSGLGKTGETYLIGGDKLLRSDTFLDSEKFNVVRSFRENQADAFSSDTIEKALRGEAGVEIAKNYRGDSVISSYMPINILGLKWGLIAEINTNEAFAASKQVRNTFLWAIGVVVFLVTFFGIYISSSLSKRIAAVTDRLLVSAKNLYETSHQVSHSSQELSKANSVQAASLQETTSSVDEINSMVQKNAEAASKSAQISEKSNQTGEQGKKRIHSMITSMKDIAESNNEVESIAKVISEISNKTKIINDIVFQTKLLSINASVEAAKAGEHGKGFAVVAEEVGNLAAISGKASLEITELIHDSTSRVSDIVKVVKDKVERGEKSVEDCGASLDDILKDASEVNSMVKEIALASAEQSTGILEVTRAMQQLDQTMHLNAGISNETEKMSKGLSKQAEGLKFAVDELVELTFGKKELSSANEKKAEHENIDNVVSLPERHTQKEESFSNTDNDSRFKEL